MSIIHEITPPENFAHTPLAAPSGSIIQSNDIEHVSHLFLRNKRAISLQNCAQFHMWQFRQDSKNKAYSLPTKV